MNDLPNAFTHDFLRFAEEGKDCGAKYNCRALPDPIRHASDPAYRGSIAPAIHRYQDTNFCAYHSAFDAEKYVPCANCNIHPALAASEHHLCRDCA